MTRLRSQNGATLILIIGVAATLAILAASLVVVMANSMGATARDSNRTKSLHVAEAGIDVAQNLLAQHWPGDASSAPTTAQLNAIYAQFDVDFPLSEFKRPSSGARETITIRDDITETSGDTVLGIDYPANDVMVLESQASVGDATTRIQVQVMRVPYPLQIPTGVALYSQGPVTLNGTGSAQNSTPIYVDNEAWNAAAYTQSGFPTINGQATFPSPPQITQITDPSISASDLFDPELIAQLKLVAQNAVPTQKYFSINSAATLEALENVQNRIVWVTHDVRVNANATLFSEDKPALLIVDGDVDLGGGVIFWGSIYAPNGTVSISGGPQVHGMVVAANLSATTTLSGNRAFSYNENVILNLNKMVTQVVRLVPGTWREIEIQ